MADLSKIRSEVEGAVIPLEKRIERLEKKIDLLSLAVERMEKMMLEAQPFLKIVNNIPFLK